MQTMIIDQPGTARVERDASFFVRFGWLLVVLGCGSFFAWAALAPLDQGVGVEGTVVVSGKRKTVQALAGGVISQIRVREGQVVEKGQLLFRQDQTQRTAEVESLQAQYQLAWASESRWLSERDNTAEVHFAVESAPTADPGLATVMEGQRQLFRSRRETFSSEQAALRAGIEGAGAQLRGTRRARGDLRAQAESLRSLLLNLRPLAQSGHIASNRLLEHERQLAQVQQQLAQNSGEVGRLEQQVVELRLRLAQHADEYQKEVHGQLAQARLQRMTLQQQLTSARFDQQHSDIYAPAAGIAVNLSIHTEGAVVGASESLLEIVPQDQRLEVEGRLPVELVDKVTVGLPVDILFTAFNQNKTPRVVGEVNLLSADQLLDDKTGMPYYVLRAAVSEHSLETLNGLSIKPGMPAQLFVRTGERSLLNYLFKPLLDRAGSALTEE